MKSVFLVLIICATTVTKSEGSQDPSGGPILCEQKCKSQCSHVRDLLRSLNCLGECMFVCDQQFAVDSKAVTDLPNNHCLQGKNPKKMSLKENLKEFAKGPCSPLLLTPGLFATRTIIEIDCDLLRKTEPDVFSVCGWNTCEKRFWEFWKSQPSSEYQIWITDLMAPFSIFSISLAANVCLTALLGMKFDFSKPVNEMIIPTPGINFRPHGYSPNTIKKAQCGRSALVDLLPLYYQLADTVNFAPMMNELDRLGYTSGLTYQAAPYNFLVTFTNNEFSRNFKTFITRMRNYTGKKVTLVGHSLGNLNILKNIQTLTEEEKSKNIANWMAIGAPFMGAHKAYQSILSGMNDFLILHEYMGIKFLAAIILASSHLSSYELGFNDPFSVFKGEKWLESVRKRIDYESNFPNIPFEQSGIPFWPRYDEECHEKQISGIKSNCFFGAFNSTSIPIFKVEEHDYFLSDLSKLYAEFGITENIKILFEKVRNFDHYKDLPNIPMINVFSSSLQSPIQWNYAKGFKDYVKDFRFPKIDSIGLIPGDETVPTISSVTLPLKWAMAHQEDPKKSKPVKFVEMCSTLHQDRSIFDEKDSGKEFKVTKSDYIGLKCKCLGRNMKDFDKCHHSTMHSDPHVISLVVELLNSHQQVSNEDFNAIDTLDEDTLRKELETCSYVKS